MDYINLCPDHVLAQVFGNLSPGLIKSCCLVCKRWNEIIGTSHKLMKRFQFKLKKSQEAMDMQRKYQSAIISSESSLDVIVRHNLQSLELTWSKETKLSTLINALNKLTALNVLNAVYTDFIDDLSESSGSFKTVSTNIEHLECAVEILHIFACCSLKKLELRCRDTINENSKKVVIDFLKKQTNLENLNLCGEAFGEFFALPDFIDLKCSLKKFKHLNGSRNFPYYEAFIRFLTHHVRSLTSLEVNFFTEPPFGLQMIHKYALENIVNLKHLKMVYFNYEDEIPFNELPTASQITKNLESLRLSGLSMDMNINKSFFDLLPNLKHLHFEYTEDFDDELLNCISERCPKLESLEIYVLYDEIYFPKLKEINIEICNDEESFCDFINRHSQTLEKITILEFEIDFTRSMVLAILKCPNLNYLKFNFCPLTFGSTMMIHEILSRKKPFTLILPGQNCKFIFPDDKAIFYDQEIACEHMLRCS